MRRRARSHISTGTMTSKTDGIGYRRSPLGSTVSRCNVMRKYFIGRKHSKLTALCAAVMMCLIVSDAGAVQWNPLEPRNYSDCISKYLPKVRSDLGSKLIGVTCENIYENKDNTYGREYDRCVLENAGGLTTHSATLMVIGSCREKHPVLCVLQWDGKKFSNGRPALKFRYKRVRMSHSSGRYAVLYFPQSLASSDIKRISNETHREEVVRACR